MFFNTKISQKVLVIRKTAVILSQKQNKTGLGRYPEQNKTKSNMEHLTNEQIADMSRREINAYFRKIDDSNLWPICGRFNATERAIRRVRKFKREYGGLSNSEYYLSVEREITNIVNDPRL